MYDTFEYLNTSDSEISFLDKLANDSLLHTSGGSYNMLARWKKGSRVVTGRNRLDRPASTMDGSYPDVCGIHAELDLHYRATLKGGTVFVAGTKSSSRSIMGNSGPCIYCAALLRESGVRAVVFYCDGEAVKVVF